MTTKNNTFEGGVHGDVITVANSDDGTSGNALAVNGSPTYSNVSPISGSISAVFAASNTYVQHTGLAATTAVCRLGFRVSSLTSINGVRLLDMRTGSAGVLRAQVNSSSQIVVQTNNGGTTVGTISTALVAGTKYMLRAGAQCANASNATIKVELYEVVTGTLVGSVSTTTASAGTTSNLSVINAGRAAADSFGSAEVVIDEFTYTDGTLTYPGMWDQTVSPTVVTLTAAAQASTVSSGSTVTPTVVGLGLSVPSPTASGSANATPTVVSLALNVPSPTASGSSGVSITPTVVGLSVAAQAPAASAGATVTPTTVTTTLSPQAPTARSSVTISPTVVGVGLSVQSPTISAAANVSISAPAASLTFTPATPSIATGAAVTASTVTLTVAAQSATVAISATASPATVTLLLEVTEATLPVPIVLPDTWTTRSEPLASSRTEPLPAARTEPRTIARSNA